MSKSKKRIKKDRPLRVTQEDFLRITPFNVDFEHTHLSKPILDELHELRRLRLIQMHWSERKTMSYPNAMTAALFRAHGRNGLDRVGMLADQRCIPTTYKVLKISAFVCPDPVKVKRDAIEARSIQIKRLHAKRDSKPKLQPDMMHA